MDYTIILQCISWVVGIVGGSYGIIMRRKIGQKQIKTEQAKTRYYNSKKKAEDMRRTKHFVEAGKTFTDWITGNKNNSLPKDGEVY